MPRGSNRTANIGRTDTTEAQTECPKNLNAMYLPYYGWDRLPSGHTLFLRSRNLWRAGVCPPPRPIAHPLPLTRLLLRLTRLLAAASCDTKVAVLTSCP